MEPKPKEKSGKDAGTNSERQENFFDVCASCKISCCQGARPPLSPKRRAFIEEQLAKNPVPGIKPPYFTNEHGYYHFLEDKDGYCIFYNRDTKLCKIHTIKGETCVAGPVTFDVNLQTKKLELYLKMECICPLAGKMWTKGKAELAKHLEDAKREIRRCVKELEPEAMKTILKIEEDETFKIYEEDLDEEVYKKLTQK